MSKLTRLTTSRDNIYFPNSNESAYTDIVRKLGILEDIEEELGIDLVTLFKALIDGVFVVGDDGLIYTDYIKRIDHWQGCWTFISNEEDIEVCLEDYGVTWALTSEELELKEDE